MHLAGVLADGVLPSLTLESLERSYAPKAGPEEFSETRFADVSIGKAMVFDGKILGKISYRNGGFYGKM